MGNGQQEASWAPPRTLRMCKTCGKQTPHQVLASSDLRAGVCIPCLERAMQYELDRD